MSGFRVIEKRILPLRGGIIEDIIVCKFLRVERFGDHLHIYLVGAHSQARIKSMRRSIIVKTMYDNVGLNEEYIGSVDAPFDTGYFHVFAGYAPE